MWKSLIVKVQDCLWFPTIYGKNKSPSVSTTSRLCTSVIAVMWGSLIMWVGLMATLVDIASFPGPAQLFVACGMEKQGEPAIFSHVR